MTQEQNGNGTDEGTDRERWPIGFILLIGITALYLGWRLIQGVAAIVGWVSG